MYTHILFIVIIESSEYITLYNSTYITLGRLEIHLQLPNKIVKKESKTNSHYAIANDYCLLSFLNNFNIYEQESNHPLFRNNKAELAQAIVPHSHTNATPTPSDDFTKSPVAFATNP